MRPTPWRMRPRRRCKTASDGRVCRAPAILSQSSPMSTHDLTLPVPATAPPWRDRLATMTPVLVLAPSLVASFIYVFIFTVWTLYLSLSNSSLLPTYGFVGLDNYASLWANRRWNIAYTNLFLF